MNYLWIDQYGQKIWAKNRKQLVAACGGGKVSIMYCDKKDGSVVRTGYVVGSRWFNQFSPVEVKA